MQPPVDSDSDSDFELDANSAYIATRYRLRLKLSAWERNFKAQHNREPAYEDKKLDTTYQSLRSELRRTELERRADVQRERETAREEGSTSRSGHSNRSGLSSLTHGQSSRHSSVADRERRDRALRSLHQSAMCAHANSLRAPVPS